MDQYIEYYKDWLKNSYNSQAPYIDAVSNLVGFNPSEIPIDRFEKVFQKFQIEKGRSNGIIEAFDNWILNRLPVQIMNHKIEDTERDTIIYFDNVQVYRPYMSVISSDKTYDGLPNWENIAPMYPRDARRLQLTYASEITVDIYSKKKSSSNNFERQLLKSNVPVGKVPIIKGSHYCWLAGMTDEEKTAVDESFEDPLGYFVVGGAEKVIIAKENLKIGQMFIANFTVRKLKKFETKENLNNIQMNVLTTLNSIKISLNLDSKNDNLFEVSFNSKSYGPVLILSLFLQYLYDQELVERSNSKESMIETCKSLIKNLIMPEILDNVLPNERQQINARMLSTVTKSLSLLERDIASVSDSNFDPISVFIKSLDRSKSEKKQSKNMFRSIIDEVKMNVFPTAADDSLENVEFNDYDRRRKMLSRLIAVFARHLEGFRPEDDRDSYLNKRIDNIGRQMEMAFNKTFKEKLNDFSKRSLNFNSERFTKSFETQIRSGARSSGKGSILSEALNRITPAAIYSQLRRITIPTDTKSTTESIRTIHPTQVGYICTGETPDGKNCGILKNMAVMCWISIPRDTDEVEDILVPFLSEEKTQDFQIPLFMNGNILGWVDPSDYLNIKKEIKTDLRTYDVSVVMNSMDNHIDVFTTGSIPTRPLLTVNPDTGMIRLFELDEDQQESMTIDELTAQGYLEYNSPSELNSKYAEPPTGQLWQNLNKGFTYIKIAEYVKDVEDLVEAHANELRFDEQPFTHAEVIPFAQFGYAASCIPKGNFNKSPRITYQSAMFAQAISRYSAVHEARYDTGFKVNLFPTRTLFETSTHKPIGINALPTTTTAILAMYIRPKNNEDAIVVKEEYLNNNLRFIYFISIVICKKDNEKIDIRPEHIDDPILQALYKPSDGVSEEMIGYPKLGAYVKKGDAILAKYRTVLDTETGVTKYIKSHCTVGIGKEGYIAGVEIVRGNNSSIVARVKIAQHRRQITGDKIASRYSQKSTCGEILPESQLPRIVGGPNDGVVPDLFFNPISIPSRLTQGKIIENEVTKASLYTGRRVNASSFGEYQNDDYIKEYEQILLDNGMERSGLETMRHPDGTLVEVQIFVGACAYQLLKHHVADKFQVRESGNHEPLTYQPVRGRFNEGGIRIGQMERDAMISHGNAAVVRNRMMFASDMYKLIVCKRCGNIARSNFDPKETSCMYCPDHKEFGVVTIPYVSHLIIRMLNAAGIHIHFKV